MASDRSVLVLAFATALVPVLLWKRPDLGPALLVAAALTIEQFPGIASPNGAGATARIPLFHGFGGFRLSDLLLALLVSIYIAKHGTTAVRPAPRSWLAKALVAFLATVAFGAFLGLATGGAIAPLLIEVRPYVYLAVAYFIAATVITRRRAVDAILWAFVLGSGLKAVQGIYIFLSVRHLSPRPESVLAHEESLFFTLFILLVFALWLYDVRGSLRRTATVLLPIVVAADLANSRRAAWLILGIGLIVVIVVGLVALPERRRFLARLSIGLALFSAVYFPAFWNKSGGLAQPARALRSAVAPSSRDALSNMYRVQEDANLRLNIRQAGPLGKGFGHPINYALPIEDISDVDPYIAYVPHNGVFYFFLRIGVLGSIAFWSLLGIAILFACRLARAPDKKLGAVAMLIACALPAYALLGYNDQGFFFYRVAFVMGTLLGLLEALRRLQSRTAAEPGDARVSPERVERPPVARARPSGSTTEPAAAP